MKEIKIIISDVEEEVFDMKRVKLKKASTPFVTNPKVTTYGKKPLIKRVKPRKGYAVVGTDSQRKTFKKMLRRKK